MAGQTIGSSREPSLTGAIRVGDGWGGSGACRVTFSSKAGLALYRLHPF